MEIRIEEINDSHFETLLELFREFVLFGKSPKKTIHSIERMKKEREYFNGFVAVNGKNEIAGYATFFFAWSTWPGKALYIDDLYIRPAFRSEGVGTLLITRILAHAKENSCYKVRWQVSDWSEPAVRFYEQLGATVDKVERNCDLLLR